MKSFLPSSLLSLSLFLFACSGGPEFRAPLEEPSSSGGVSSDSGVVIVTTGGNRNVYDASQTDGKTNIEEGGSKEDPSDSNSTTTVEAGKETGSRDSGRIQADGQSNSPTSTNDGGSQRDSGINPILDGRVSDGGNPISQDAAQNSNHDAGRVPVTCIGGSAPGTKICDEMTNQVVMLCSVKGVWIYNWNCGAPNKCREGKCI